MSEDNLVWTTEHLPEDHSSPCLRGGYSVWVRDPATGHEGWAARKDEEEARQMALKRLRYIQDGYR